jgi:hypothetical protein
VEASKIAGILDSRVMPPCGHEVEAVARVTKIAAKCIHAQSCLRSTYTRTKLAEQK